MTRFYDWLDENRLSIEVVRVGQSTKERNTYIIPHEWEASFRTGRHSRMTIKELEHDHLRFWAHGYGMTPEEAISDLVNTLAGKTLQYVNDFLGVPDIDYNIPVDLTL